MYEEPHFPPCLRIKQMLELTARRDTVPVQGQNRFLCGAKECARRLGFATPYSAAIPLTLRKVARGADALRF